MTITFKDPNGVSQRLMVCPLAAGPGLLTTRDAKAADLLSVLGQLSTPEPENALGEERYDFTTTAGNAGLLMVYVTNGLGQHYRRANRVDVTAALKEKGETAVKLSTGSDGLTKADRRRIFQDAYLRASEAGDPDRTFVSDCGDAGYQALIVAGLALGEQKQAARVRELLERSNVLETENEELGERAESAEVKLAEAESELAATKAKLAEVERERDEARSELASARRVVEAAKRHDGAHRNWLAVERYDAVLAAWGRGIEQALAALASAGTDADRTEAADSEQTTVPQTDGEGPACP